MSVIDYINRSFEEPGVQALLESLGSVIPDEYGGLKMLDYPEKGVAVYFDERDKVRTVYLYSNGRDNRQQSVIELPHGLTFDDTYSDVVTKLGKPQQLGQPVSERRWARFDYGSHSVHLEFEPGTERLSLARIMVAV